MSDRWLEKQCAQAEKTNLGGTNWWDGTPNGKPRKNQTFQFKFPPSAGSGTKPDVGNHSLGLMGVKAK